MDERVRQATNNVEALIEPRSRGGNKVLKGSGILNRGRVRYGRRYR